MFPQSPRIVMPMEKPITSSANQLNFVSTLQDKISKSTSFILVSKRKSMTSSRIFNPSLRVHLFNFDPRLQTKRDDFAYGTLVT